MGCILNAALALLACLPLVNGVAQAAAAAPVAPQAQHQSIRGVISSIDAQQRQFELDLRNGRQVTVQVGAHTRITVGGNPATFASLAVGQRASVTGRYDPQRMVFHAHTVAARN